MEPKPTNPDFADKKHRAYEGLNNVYGESDLTLLSKGNICFFDFNIQYLGYSSFEK